MCHNENLISSLVDEIDKYRGSKQGLFIHIARVTGFRFSKGIIYRVVSQMLTAE